MPLATFLNRQALHLHPDPARVVVRRFGPSPDPRDMNPTDKLRANHIVARVMGLSQDGAASQLGEVLENFMYGRPLRCKVDRAGGAASGRVRSCMRPVRAALFHDRWP